jgi:hypothetical protein
MNINNAYPSKYLKASDLDGRNVTVTIKSAELEEIGFDPRSGNSFSVLLAPIKQWC